MQTPEDRENKKKVDVINLGSVEVLDALSMSKKRVYNSSNREEWEKRGITGV